MVHFIQYNNFTFFDHWLYVNGETCLDLMEDKYKKIVKSPFYIRLGEFCILFETPQLCDHVFEILMNYLIALEVECEGDDTE